VAGIWVALVVGAVAAADVADTAVVVVAPVVVVVVVVVGAATTKVADAAQVPLPAVLVDVSV
jgi:hypothetical protein